MLLVWKGISQRKEQSFNSPIISFLTSESPFNTRKQQACSTGHPRNKAKGTTEDLKIIMTLDVLDSSFASDEDIRQDYPETNLQLIEASPSRDETNIDYDSTAEQFHNLVLLLQQHAQQTNEKNAFRARRLGRFAPGLSRLEIWTTAKTAQLSPQSGQPSGRKQANDRPIDAQRQPLTVSAWSVLWRSAPRGAVIRVSNARRALLDYPPLQLLLPLRH
jgi:hypothetical protein